MVRERKGEKRAKGYVRGGGKFGGMHGIGAHVNYFTGMYGKRV